MGVKKSKNIFLDVVTSENLMTELFRNFLSFKAFRNPFLQLFLEKNKANQINFDSFYTQYSLTSAIPDLAILHDNFEILIEIKIGNTILTKNQPDKYLQHLLTNANSKEKWLIFLIPRDYIYINKLKFIFNEFLKANPDSSINTKIIYWHDIMKIIKDNNLDILNHSFNDFLGLMKIWFEFEILNFDPTEIEYMFTSTVIPELLTKLFAIVNNIKNLTSKVAKSNIGSTSDWYGIEFKNSKGEYILWFGIWYSFWKKYNKPICICVHNYYKKGIIDKFKKKHSDKIIEFETCFVSWIDKDMITENAIGKIKNIVEETLIELL